MKTLATFGIRVDVSDDDWDTLNDQAVEAITDRLQTFFDDSESAVFQSGVRAMNKTYGIHLTTHRTDC